MTKQLQEMGERIKALREIEEIDIKTMRRVQRIFLFLFFIMLPMCSALTFLI